MFGPSNECGLFQKGETPLHYAAQLSKSKVKGNADIDIVKLLLEHGADCTAVTLQVRGYIFTLQSSFKNTVYVREMRVHLHSTAITYILAHVST